MRVILSVLLLAGLAADTLPAGAQQIVVRRDAPPAWLGVSYDLRWLQSDSDCEARVVIEGVVPGSPAERAGLRPGDAIRSVDGDPAAATRVQLLGSRLAPGDSVRLVIERGGSTRTVVAVADRRPERPPPAPRPDVQGPRIFVRGDTLVAMNVEAAPHPARSVVRGYWITDAGGRTEFRRLTARPRAELDRRVATLLTCVDTAGHALALPVRADMERIHERADSLRMVIASRALAQQDLESRSAQLQEAMARAQAVFAGEAFSGSGRSVAGAEIVALEPELAAYFQGVREGLLVVRVAPGSPAGRSGLRPGDVITAAGGRAVTSPAGLRSALMVDGPAVDLAVVRQGRRRAISLPRP